MTEANSRKQAYLQCVAGQHAGQRLPLSSALILGTADSAGISIQDEAISDHHAKFEQQGSGWSIEAVDAQHEIWVNGSRISGSQSLRSGDEIRLGKQRFVVKTPGLRPDSVLRDVPASSGHKWWPLWVALAGLGAGAAAYWYWFLP